MLHAQWLILLYPRSMNLQILQASGVFGMAEGAIVCTCLSANHRPIELSVLGEAATI
jgi:hypothetical protein